MQAELDDILSRVGMWCGEERDHCVIDRLPLRDVDSNAGKRGTARFERTAVRDERAGDVTRARSTQPNNADSATPRRRRNGYDGVVSREHGRFRTTPNLKIGRCEDRPATFAVRCEPSSRT